MGLILDEIKNREIKRLDYVGFTFNNIHSSQLHILKVSDGSRNHASLLPTIEDYTVDIVGGIGANYFGGRYKSREFTFDIAFDRITETDLRGISEWLGDRDVHTLWFDETPYKVYYATISKAPTIKYVPFDENVDIQYDINGKRICTGTGRLYKGEGSITFTCHDPIAYSLNGNYLNNYLNFNNLKEWSEASGMLDSNTSGNTIYDVPFSGRITAYNAGVLDTPFKIYINWNSPILTLTNRTTQESLTLKRTASSNIDILLDSERSLAALMYGKTEYTMNNNIREYTILNQLIASGHFFKLKPGKNELSITGGNISNIQYYHRYL